MPYYHRLRIRDNDLEEVKAHKRRVATRLLELRAAIVNHMAKSSHGETEEDCSHRHSDSSARFMRLATWNIREFDSAKYGERLEESYYYIAEILSNFDLIAIQEVREDVAALKKVVRILGDSWDYIATDVAEGHGGNRERMVFVYNRARVWFRNIAGELVLPAGDKISYPHEERLSFDKQLHLQLAHGTKLESPTDVATRKRSGKRYLKKELVVSLPRGTQLELPSDSELVLPVGYEIELMNDGRVVLPQETKLTLKKKGKNKKVMIRLPKGAIVGNDLQFARTPSIVAFQCGWLKVNLCTVHIYYGSGRQGLTRRKREIRQLTHLLSERAVREKDSDSDSVFVVLGDFNIVDKSHETMKALLTNGFRVPAALKTLHGTNVDHSKAYDQIAYWTDPDGVGAASRSVTKFEVHRAGVFDFFDTVFRIGKYDQNGEDQQYYTSLGDYAPTWKYKQWRTYQMSDHLPMWIELRIDFSDEYLKRICEAE